MNKQREFVLKCKFTKWVVLTQKYKHMKVEDYKKERHLTVESQYFRRSRPRRGCLPGVRLPVRVV